MSTIVSDIFGLSIFIAAIFAIFRCRSCDKIYLPFFLLLWVAATNEVLNVSLFHSGINININNNVYVLAESILILWFFRKTGPTLSNNRVLLLLALSYLVFWIVENFITGRIQYISSYFRIYYSFVTVILGISTVNHLIVTQNQALWKLPVFLVSLGLIIFFTYKILVEAFWVYGLNDSKSFRGQVYYILYWVNLFVNLIFAVAVLWIPRKREYTLLP